MRAKVDKELCIGCELCPEICSDIFVMDMDDKAIAKDIEIPVNLEDDVQDAASQCPIDAIVVIL